MESHPRPLPSPLYNNVVPRATICHHHYCTNDNDNANNDNNDNDHNNNDHNDDYETKVNHLFYTIAKCLPIICDAQKCTCFLVDDDKDELWVVQGELNMRVPKSKGIVGAVATSGNVSKRRLSEDCNRSSIVWPKHI